MRGLLAHLHSSELVARFQTTCGLYPAAEENSFHSGCHHLNEHALSNGNVGVVHRHRGEEGTEKLNGVTREQDNNSNYTGPGIKGLKVRLWFNLIGDLLYKYFCFLLWPIPRALCEGRPSRLFRQAFLVSRVAVRNSVLKNLCRSQSAYQTAGLAIRASFSTLPEFHLC